MPADWQAGGFGLYIHWPFCAAKCPYCDFNSHVTARIDQSAWREAYLREIGRVGAETEGRVLQSVYFGGGTPSLMEPETVDAILREIGRFWPRANDIEITLEANPSSVEARRFAGYAEAGVNRVSLGVQSLRDTDLRALGRLHDVAQAKAAVEVAKAHFGRMSFDLIYARQNQTLEDWRSELSEALEMAGDHLSLYQLTIEPGTAFGDRYAIGKLRGLPDDDLGADMFELTQEMTSAAGFEAYEVSNHAQSGSESRHNLVYWRYGDYIGIGPGAHGRVTFEGERMATVCKSMPAAWLEGVKAGNAESRERLSGGDQASEYLMMGLRVGEGISLSRFSALSGEALPAEKLGELVGSGLVAQDGDRLRATLRGRMVLNAVIRELMV
ncbi:radical SAM family heme chaperone HemW [Oceanicola sp. 502str15]|uniref:radical SAM family heme chaperone HemW n=1 Tax=Oceanicola sp. 502str15 TaxID=2696061 RepID=UPI00209537F6|nr:radical SAM family heme chaperone HemW [Oceanicola sp. 502str15]MCO6384196.1 coproporphyrinogen III oxidase [Oceanicola sp. 502str15]